MRKILLIILAVLLGIIALAAIAGSITGGSSSNNNNTNVQNAETNDAENEADTAEEESNSSESSEEESGNTVKKGGSFEKDGLKFTYKKFKDNYKPSDDKYGLSKPSKGKKFIACTFKFENKSDSDKYVSIYDFACYADNESCEQEYISTDDFKNNDFINENLSPGRNVTFTTFYQVPKKAKNVQLEYESDVWTNEKIIIEVK